MSALRRLLPDTLAGRTILVLLIGLGLFHVLSVLAYEASVAAQVDAANDSRLAERLVSIARTLGERPAADREGVAHALSGGALEAHWAPAALAVANDAETPDVRSLRARIAAAAANFAPRDIVIGADGPGEPHQLLVSLKSGEGWATFGVARLATPAGHGGLVVSTSLMGVGIVVASILMVRWTTRPLSRLAEALRRSYVSGQAVRAPLNGPRELRDLGEAFNAMQGRIETLIVDRTQTLAAISHDLKTPLTRLRLRTGDLAAPDAQADMEADLDEMEAMLDQTLQFLRGEAAHEPTRKIDLVAMLQTIVQDMTDRGLDVTLAPGPPLIVEGRPLALKRALRNLVWNAVNYGRRAAIVADGYGRRVTIEDDGPGIPENRMEDMFAPFIRLEASRSRETGGVGLGLTIARAALRAHGGDVLLANRREGGLRATVRLPAPPTGETL